MTPRSLILAVAAFVLICSKDGLAQTITWNGPWVVKYAPGFPTKSGIANCGPYQQLAPGANSLNIKAYSDSTEWSYGFNSSCDQRIHGTRLFTVGPGPTIVNIRSWVQGTLSLKSEGWAIANTQVVIDGAPVLLCNSGLITCPPPATVPVNLACQAQIRLNPGVQHTVVVKMRAATFADWHLITLLRHNIADCQNAVGDGFLTVIDPIGTSPGYSPDLSDWNEGPCPLDGTQAASDDFYARRKARETWNCYNYATKVQTRDAIGKPVTANPGRGRKWPNLGHNLTASEWCTKVKDRAILDGLVWLGGSPTDPIPEPPLGYNLVLLGVEAGIKAPVPGRGDYHWWRRNGDGTWSHKRGKRKAKTTYTDAMGMEQPLTDPRQASQRDGYDFCGFMAVPKDPSPNIGPLAEATPSCGPRTDTVWVCTLVSSGPEDLQMILSPSSTSQLLPHLPSFAPSNEVPDPQWSDVPAGQSAGFVIHKGENVNVPEIPRVMQVFNGVVEVFFGDLSDTCYRYFNDDNGLEQHLLATFDPPLGACCDSVGCAECPECYCQAMAAGNYLGDGTTCGVDCPLIACEILHDGTTESSVGTGNAADDILWMHSQGIVGTTTVVKSISTAWGSLSFGGGPPNGTPARVGIWVDPNNDGNPIDAVLIQEVNTTIAGTNSDALQTVNLSPSVQVTGNYFIGASCTGGTSSAPLDQSSGPGAGQVWIVANTSGPINYNSLGSALIPPTDEDTIARGHWVLQSECVDPPITSFCFGDGTGAACPCANSGATTHGCQNSASTGGAQLSATGNPSLSADTVLLTSRDELPSAFSIFLQGTTDLATPAAYGDGLRCVGGSLKRLYKESASGGIVAAPAAGDPSITARSAALGDPISSGETRSYQVYYRDANAGFCPNPPGSTFNISQAVRILWGP